ncbi:putative Serine/threonine-protein phosphatase 5 [Monocercomonoides exilis]|uniref:putative Serine/threonine-protein phosphatase 5 n=1 Tax=Monocercomonoides exilis TaxID=2049356 RepID=UPI003559E8FA|nr:putative Serine/threonine-protein phosphatase 5 [Monocercomonoides exilis]|eukprot:MONOS_4987.1-p1 / transcript=MONOS_4987.1 / gene=MONOS_4987 / organism=Monocercomonoides_exilis_PA203 / gene_product=serine / transcript_product=serine / location=Mono_scaffold00140:9547-11270(+) / protein_length=322 / sequence_SO=supercontig / SO=protein_coding / is_pseudo=false
MARFLCPENINRTTLPRLINALKHDQQPSDGVVKKLITDFKNMVKTYPNIIDIEIPEGKSVTVVGDIHGQFFDLLHIFDLNGLPSEELSYIFLGDWIDRGSFSIETCITLYALKVCYPEHVHLIRGNHETAFCARDYGFRSECLYKYDITIYANFMESFNTLPLCAILNKRIFLVHGGLFNRLGVTLDDIQKVDRFHEPGQEGGELFMTQMLWSDPSHSVGVKESYRPYGHWFGPDVTQDFLETNSLKLVIRSHELRKEGFSVEQKKKLISIFSAPSYQGVRNKGAFLRISSPKLEIVPVIFTSVAQPHTKLFFYPTPERGI